MIPIKFANLHNPLFFAGKNFGLKLDPGNLAGLDLEFDPERNWLIVHFAGKTSYIPFPNISSMEEGQPEKRAVQYTHPIVAGIASAQVETPYGHVHAGPGKGKTGK